MEEPASLARRVNPEKALAALETLEVLYEANEAAPLRLFAGSDGSGATASILTSRWGNSHSESPLACELAAMSGRFHLEADSMSSFVASPLKSAPAHISAGPTALAPVEWE